MQKMLRPSTPQGTPSNSNGNSVKWRVTDSSLSLSGSGDSPEAALAELKGKIRVLTCRASRAYAGIAKSI